MARSLDCSRCLSVAEIKASNSPSPGAVEKLLRAEPGTEPTVVKGSRAHCARQRGGGVGPELRHGPACREATWGSSSMRTASLLWRRCSRHPGAHPDPTWVRRVDVGPPGLQRRRLGQNPQLNRPAAVSVGLSPRSPSHSLRVDGVGTG